MTPPIPPDAKRYVIAAVVPCETVPTSSELCADRLLYNYRRCPGCNGDGTRWVVTDTRVEPREVVVPSGPTETWWRPTS